ncbi:transcriptional regulator [Sphaerisporangium siamense]|uniref:Transcriptional regulator with XRE-family HTH domain n=1 Tax=Sphaerisporangium siamense TaxID=795645 RepID=A0A7W7D3I1_9ACTN|nr:helix-turn-helix transcriptional regulator [Sphaerisporangium siamense]MBB4699617.1 transcriptional regulator with XRE-family HTH domain [Sphaerisporangium siamense]GII87031.1 transcriptional regulator [Sphaerisporangium siamense]
MYDNGTTTGARLRMLRKWRKKSLVELAGQAGVSKSFLSMVERGERALDRRSHIAAIARALQVSEADLVGGPHLSHDPVQSGPYAYVPALRVALETNSLTSAATDHARPLPDLLEDVAKVDALTAASDYLAIGRMLPGIIDELHVHIAAPADEQQMRRALEALIEACRFAVTPLKELGHPDLAHLAAVRAAEAGVVLGDPVQQGKADFLRVQTMPREGSWDRTLRAAEQAADRMQPHLAEPGAVPVCGMLTLTAALAAASVHNNAGAAHWLREAADLAKRVSDDMTANWAAFSTTNVGIWNVAIAVERGEVGGAVLDLAGRVREDKALARPSRYVSMMADVGRGLAREKTSRHQAIGWLRRAETAAPQRVRNSPLIRETVAVLLNQQLLAAGGRELRGMAARMGLPH